MRDPIIIGLSEAKTLTSNGNLPDGAKWGENGYAALLIHEMNPLGGTRNTGAMKITSSYLVNYQPLIHGGL
jgi:hypothetical protein